MNCQHFIIIRVIITHTFCICIKRYISLICKYKIFDKLFQRCQFFTCSKSFFGDLVLKVISKSEDFAIFIIDANLTDVSAAWAKSSTEITFSLASNINCLALSTLVPYKEIGGLKKNEVLQG